LSYLVLARKWRPQTFEEILGQEAVTRTLKNAITRNRVAHAFLFSGPRGVGKTTTARVLAKALNCLSFDGPTTTPCGKCAACTEIAEGSAVDVLEIDGASNTGVDNIRELREAVRYTPASLRTKVYIIDEVHMLSKGAFNALLKTLEEPPPHVVFMFATTEPHKVPQTILSRCQRYDFHRVGTHTLVDHLKVISDKEGIKLPEGALRVIAREADGSVRDALSLMDQVASFGGEDISEEEVLAILGVVDRTLVWDIARAVLERDAAAALRALHRSDEAGHDVKQVASELLKQFRDLVVVKLAREPERLIDLPGQEIEMLAALAESHSLETLERLFDQLARLEETLARAGQPVLMLEMTLVKMAVTPPMAPVAELIARLEEIEAGLKSGDYDTGPGSGADSPLFSGKREREGPGEEDERASSDQPGWNDFLAFVEKKDAKLHQFLSGGIFEGRSGHEWRLAFTPGLSLQRLLNQQNAKKVQELAAEFMGEGHRIIITEHRPAAAEKKKPSRHEEENRMRREATEDPVVQAVLEKLGGEINNVKIK